MAVFMCGCSLAIPEAGSDGDGARLIGAFITSEYLELFDMEDYLNAHASKLMDGKEITVANDDEYGQRLYATIDKHDSTDSSDWEISFQDIEGINFFSPLWTDEEGERFWGNVHDEEVGDSNISINVSETEEENVLTGTIYILPGRADEDTAYYANPVYQTSDGRIYVTTGTGFSTSGDSSEGVYLTTTLSGQVDITENGKTKTEKSSVSISIAVMYKPVKITFYQMDAAHQIIKKEEYTPGKVPETWKTEPGTEYILIETEKENLSGEKFISREIYDSKEEEETTAETYYALKNGTLAKQETEIDWNTEDKVK